jgi:hypothetical protein
VVPVEILVCISGEDKYAEINAKELILFGGPMQMCMVHEPAVFWLNSLQTSAKTVNLQLFYCPKSAPGT